MPTLETQRFPSALEHLFAQRPSGVSWSQRVAKEPTSFAVELGSRIQLLIARVLGAANTQDYRRSLHGALQRYSHLTALLDDELECDAPLTEDDVIGVLDRVEQSLGESGRHRLEHALNKQRGAERIRSLTRMDRATALARQKALPDVLLYSHTTTRVRWCVDVIVCMTCEPSMRVPLLDVVFDDLEAAATQSYIAAWAVRSVCDPVEEDDDTDMGWPMVHDGGAFNGTADLAL